MNRKLYVNIKNRLWKSNYKQICIDPYVVTEIIFILTKFTHSSWKLLRAFKIVIFISTSLKLDSLNVDFKLISIRLQTVCRPFFPRFLRHLVNKVVIYVCLFVWPIISQGPLNRFVSNFNWGTLYNQGNVLSLGKKV